jgi:beta-lactamase regulating signal transducer with metallopeptidase domain/protein involved in polysaccharide export with SLBB domain
VIPFIDAVVGPGLSFLADWSLRWAALIALLALGLALVRPRRAALRSLAGTTVLLAGLALPLVPRWGPGWEAGGTITVPAAPEAPVRPLPEPAVEPPQELSPSKGPGGPPPAVRRPARAPRRAPPPTAAPVEPPGPDAAGQPWGARRVAALALAASWSTAVLFLLARWAAGALLLRRLRRGAVPLGGPAAGLFAACRAEMGVRRPVALAAHPRVRSPITLGLFRPAILVGPGWEEMAEPAQRGCLLHELAHLRRRDDGWALLPELVRVAFFFHPLVRWLLARLERERELLCDEAAVHHGADPHVLAQALLAFARQAGRLAPAPFALCFGRRRTVKARIHHLLEDDMQRSITPLPARRAVALAALVLGLALGLGTVRVRGLGPEAPAAKPPPAPAAPKSTGAVGGEDGKARGPYRIAPFDVLEVRALGTLPGQPIAGLYLVEPDGKVELGPSYGKVPLAGLTLDEAGPAVVKYLHKRLVAPRASVSLAGWVVPWRGDAARKAPYRIKAFHVLNLRVNNALADQPIAGPHLVGPDGKVELGPAYGKVPVQGLTLEEAASAIDKHLRRVLRAPQVAVTLGGWERDWHDLRKSGPGAAAPPAKAKGALRYGGKSFEDWRKEATTELKPAPRIEALKAMAAFGANGYGTEATAVLDEVMRGYDCHEGTVTILQLGLSGDVPAGLGGGLGGGLGLQTDPDDARVVRAAFQAVRKIGAAAVPTLGDRLQDESRRARRFAVLSLRMLETQAPSPLEDDDGDERPRATLWVVTPAAPALLKALGDEDRLVRTTAISLFAEGAPDYKGFVPALVKLLKAESAEVRSDAIRALGELGRRAKPAVPALKALLKDKDKRVRQQAEEALSQIAGGGGT